MSDRAYAAGEAAMRAALEGRSEVVDGEAAVEAWRAAFDHLNQRIISAPIAQERPAAEVAAALAVDNSTQGMRRRYEPAKAQDIDAARAAKTKAAKAKKAARKKGRR